MTQDEFRSLCASHLGKPYIWGADGPEHFDCSGLAQWMLAAVNLDPPADQTASGLYRHFRGARSAAVSPDAAELGDLVFYGRPSRIGHIAIAWGDNEIFEAGGGGPETISVKIARRQRAEVRIAQLDRRPVIVAVLRPSGLPWH